MIRALAVGNNAVSIMAKTKMQINKTCGTHKDMYER